MSVLIVAEVALAIALTAGAGWLVQSFARLGAVYPGFVPEGRLVVVRDPEQDGSVGLLVDEVLDLAPMEEAAHEPPAEVEASLPSGWIVGVLSPESSRLVTLLDLTHVLDRKTLAAEEKR